MLYGGLLLDVGEILTIDVALICCAARETIEEHSSSLVQVIQLRVEAETQHSFLSACSRLPFSGRYSFLKAAGFLFQKRFFRYPENFNVHTIHLTPILSGLFTKIGRYYFRF